MTCREARQVLSQAGIEMNERDMRANPLSEAEIRSLLNGRPASTIYSFRGRQNKILGINPETLTDDEMIALMAREPALIRRPTIVVNGEILAGVNRKQVEDWVRRRGEGK